MVMETSKPDLDDQNKLFTRQQALQELAERRGGTRLATESDQTPWFTLWK